MKIKDHGGGFVSFKCPGCGDYHSLNVVPNGPLSVWTYNGDADKPTFSPSVASTSGHYADGNKEDCWCTYNREHPEDVSFECTICHSFVVDGRIQFLGDCTHALAGQTVDLPDYEVTA